MAKTKIVLNRQSDLILTSPSIIAPIGIVKGDIPELNSDLSNLSAADAAEALRATAAEAAESAARISADSAETLRATAAEGAESAARIAADSAEALRATAAEGLLQGNIDVEKAKIDAILLASDADKNSFAEIVTLINSVDATNDDVFAGYVLSNNAALSAEIANRISDVNTEESRASAAEAAEAARAIAAEGTLQTNITAESAARIADVNAEEARAIAAESAEALRATAAEGTLQTNISAEAASRIADVNAEETRATDAEGVLQSNISAEAASRIAADSALTSAYTSADSAITAAYTAADSAEASVRSLADITLQGNINVEKAKIDAILLASDADKDSFAEIVTLINSVDTANDSAFAGYVLSNNAAVAANAATAAADVDAEEARALAAEALLSGRITSEVSDRIADVNTEEARAIAAEGALGTRITPFEQAVTSNGITKTPYVSAVSPGGIKLGGALTANTTITSNGSFGLSLGTPVAKLGAVDINSSGLVSITGTQALFQTTGGYGNLALNSLSGPTLQTGNNGTIQSINIKNLTGTAGIVNTATVGPITNTAVSMGITTTGLLGAVYGADYSATFVDNSLVSKKYTDTADTALDGKITVEKGRVDAILLASDADKNSFAEIVTLINSVDTTNDEAFAGYVLLNNAAVAAEIANRAADVDAEETRALGAESLLSGRITTEVDARIADVDVEEARALAAEALLSGRITSEASARSAADVAETLRATAAESAEAATRAAEVSRIDSRDLATEIRIYNVEGSVSAEIAARIADVNAEEARAIAAETTLQDNVNVEKGRVDAILLASDADKNSFAEIVALINTVDTTNDEAFAGYVLSNNAAVAAESAARSAADVAETLRATAVENTKISTVDATAFNTRALLAEGLLSGRITAEVDRATIAEAGLDGRIVSIISNIDITAIDSFSETVSKVNTSFSSTSTSLSAYTISNRPSMKGFNEAPNAVRVLFTSGVVLGTEIVFLNGLMQVSGALNDYTVTSNPITGMLMVTFMTAPALADKVNIYGVTSGIAIPAPSVVA